MDDQPVERSIEVIDVGEELPFEGAGEEDGIEHEFVMRLEEGGGEFAVGGEVWEFVDGVELDPLVGLGAHFAVVAADF